MGALMTDNLGVIAGLNRDYTDIVQFYRLKQANTEKDKLILYPFCKQGYFPVSL